MRKTYIQPAIEIQHMVVEHHLLALSDRKVKGHPYVRFGSDLPEESFGHAAWVNEGYTKSVTTVDYFDGIAIGGDDYGELDSRAGAGLWDER